ncbi:hypothetical protein C8Q73DRAFT_108972 [Cubamyces lactineus]|nr:hypothetical protein C8Q73DRAFT_108972 [Cubamyces lactineus]
MATGFNISSVILRGYPDTSPWDISSIYWLWPNDFLLDLKPCDPFPVMLKEGALKQAQVAKVNPFHFMCMNNPFALDRPSSDFAHAPLPLSDLGDVPPLRKHANFEATTLESCDEVLATDECIIYRIRLGEKSRLLKLYLGPNADEHFNAECSAYERFLLHDTSSSGSVLRCWGWAEVSLHQLLSGTGAQGAINLHRYSIDTSSTGLLKGLVLDDLPGAEALSIHNISPDLTQSILRSLYSVHTAYVLQGSPIRQSVLVSPADKKAAWVDFSRSSCDRSSGALSRQTLLAELAEAWHLVYQRLLPDSLIGWEAGSDAIDPRTLTGNPVQQTSLRGPRARPVSLTVQDEIEMVLSSYPEVDIYSWDPPVSNLTPAPRLDHRLDTDDFVRVMRGVNANGLYPFFRWYGMCPLTAAPFTPYHEVNPGEFRHYVAPPPLAKIPSDTVVDLLEHIRPLADHPLFKVRIGQQTWLMKMFSKDRRPQNKDFESAKKRYERERDAYAHLTHYGACTAEVVPQCLGWIELSHKHVYDAIDMIRRTRDSGTLPGGAEPAWVSPIFEDGSVACALIIEYIEDAEPMSYDNLTMARMDLILRALARVHNCYVQHGDLENWNNVLIIRGRDGSPDRAMVIDFDHALTPGSPHLGPRTVQAEFRTLWNFFCGEVLPMQRIFCKEPKHPHAVEF